MPGPKRLPCPGMGQPPSHVTVQPHGRNPGRGGCSVCTREVCLSRNRMVGYHTSILSELRPEAAKEKSPCARCKGSGSVIGYRQVRTQCPECWGSGETPDPDAPTMNGRFTLDRPQEGRRG